MEEVKEAGKESSWKVPKWFSLLYCVSLIVNVFYFQSLVELETHKFNDIWLCHSTV